ncbi:helix-turn-helix domain-containing protein [Chryseobacterium sp. RU33C]|uniref:helix-turn-helix domain-containing protein n=1 Tax=Chryseobacterium sp. RU33C TaxID=1907398 RepID=UPI0009548050|nr:helix-turn-helix transcriptional regulator [Chryseobacterium sp. RU33C]SIP94944.1 AraC-type DNA-binding protein [Chryseobacterium sp. RU33C]
MIVLKKVFILFFLLSIKVYCQISDRSSREIDSLIQKDQWDLAHYKLTDENTQFKRLSRYPLHYHLLIKLDSVTVLYKKGKYPQSGEALLRIIKEIHDNKKELKSYYSPLNHIAVTRLFYIEKRLGNVSQGLKYLSFFSSEMESVYRKKQKLLFGVAHIELGNYKKGIEILNSRLKDIKEDYNHLLFSKFLHDKETAATYNTKGDAFIKWYKSTGEKKYLDSSRYSYNMAFNIMKDSPYFSNYSKALHLYRQANTALLQKKYHDAGTLFTRCEKNPELMNKNLSRECVWVGKAETCTYLKKTDSAFYYINKIDNEKNSECSYENKLKILHLLSLNYENIGDNKNAYKYAKISLSEIDRINQQKHVGNYFLGKYEQQEIILSSKKMIEENEKKSFILITVIIFISTLTIVLFIYHYKRKSNTYSGTAYQEREHDAIPFTEGIPLIIDNELVNQILKKLEDLESGKKFLSNNFKLSNLAKQLNTNTAYLSQIINQHKGMSFSEYVNDLRIDYIVSELQNNSVLRKYTIQTMSKEAGYKSTTTFISAFKKKTMTTPSEYIRKLKNVD